MSENELYELVLKGHKPAVDFMRLIAKASQVMDDLVDQDKEIRRVDIEDCFYDLMVVIPSNPFYRQYQDRLVVVIGQVLNDWFVANDLERSPGIDNRRIAFVIRNSLVQLLNECCLIVGGATWLRQHAVKIRKFVHNEPYEDYQRGLG